MAQLLLAFRAELDTGSAVATSKGREMKSFTGRETER
jgi:hypothetical protein